MKRYLLPSLAVLLIGLVSGSDAPRAYDDTIEISGVEGTWQLLAVEYRGQKVNSISWVYTFRQGQFLRKDSNGDQGKGKYKLDTARRPQQMDLRPDPGTQYASWDYILEVRGDTLRIGWLASSNTRPRSFSDPDLYLGTYKRVNK